MGENKNSHCNKTSPQLIQLEPPPFYVTPKRRKRDVRVDGYSSSCGNDKSNLFGSALSPTPTPPHHLLFASCPRVCRRSSEIKWDAFNCLLSLMKSNVVVQRVASVPPILPPLIASLSFSGLLGTTIKTMRWRWWHGQAGRINWMKAINCGTN